MAILSQNGSKFALTTTKSQALELMHGMNWGRKKQGLSIGSSIKYEKPPVHEEVTSAMKSMLRYLPSSARAPVDYASDLMKCSQVSDVIPKSNMESLKLRYIRLKKEAQVARLNEALCRAGETTATAGSQAARWLMRVDAPIQSTNTMECLYQASDDGDLTQVNPGLSANEVRNRPDGWFISPFDQIELLNSHQGVEIGVFTPLGTWIVGVFEFGLQVKKQMCLMIRCNIDDLVLTWNGDCLLYTSPSPRD